MVQELESSRVWRYPACSKRYQLRELAASNFLPTSKALELEVCSSGVTNLDLQVGLHQYSYNIGNTPTTLSWEQGGATHQVILAPGDSAYLKPFVKHAFDGVGAKMLILRIGGHLGSEALRELSAIGPEFADRVIRESAPWFNAEGKRS